MGDKMIKAILFLLNLPWTALGILVGILSLPISTRFDSARFIMVVCVEKLWLNSFFLGRRAKGFTLGNIILLDRKTDNSTYDHELVHIQQFQNLPFIFPLLYCLEFIRKGYQRNRYEEEACPRAKR